ncbi:MAG: hypothetical protein AB4080_14550 [Trichodesmium sp.]
MKSDVASVTFCDRLFSSREAIATPKPTIFEQRSLFSSLQIFYTTNHFLNFIVVNS